MPDLLKVMEHLKRQEQQLSQSNGGDREKIEDGNGQKDEIDDGIPPRIEEKPKKEEKLVLEAEKNYPLDAEKTAAVFGQSEEDISKEFKEFKALKLFRKMDCDLTNVLTAKELCSKIEEMASFGFGNVVVNPTLIKDAKTVLKGRKTGVYAAVCFPYGEELFGVKRYAVKKAFEEGADGVYLPIGVAMLKKGRLDQVKREVAKIVKRHKKKRIFAVLEVGEMDFELAEKAVKALLKLRLAGIVSGSGSLIGAKNFTGASNLHSLSGGKRTVIACTNTEKSREVVNLFTVADRVFLKNAQGVAKDLRLSLEF